jgi:hypothetical protein
MTWRTRHWRAFAVLGIGAILTGHLSVDHATGAPPRPEISGSDGIILPVAVFGRDDRTALPERLAGVASRMGVLFNNPARTVCSAFCVAPAVIATAAHCVCRDLAAGRAPPGCRLLLRPRLRPRTRLFAVSRDFAVGSTAQHIYTGEFRPQCAPADRRGARLGTRAPRASRLPAGWTAGSPCDERRYSRNGQCRSPLQRFLSPRSAELDGRPTPGPAMPRAISAPARGRRSRRTSRAQTRSSCTRATRAAPLRARPSSPRRPTDRSSSRSTSAPMCSRASSPSKASRPRATQTETIANTAVNARVFADQIAAFETAASILRAGNPIRQLQEHLAAFGYYGGRADGDYGPVLKAAIVAYEKCARPARRRASRPQPLLDTARRRGHQRSTDPRRRRCAEAAGSGPSWHRRARVV